MGRCGSLFGMPEGLMSNLSCSQIDGVYAFAGIMTLLTIVGLFILSKRCVLEQQKGTGDSNG